MKREYRHYLLDILNSIKMIENFVKGYRFEDFIKDRKTIDACIRNLEIIGEASKNVPNEIKNKYTNLPWKEMTRMRDKLIHQYQGVDLEIVWQVIEKRLPELRIELEKIKEEFEK